MNAKQLEFLKKHQLCRLATASKDATPHVVPVIYAVDGDSVVIVTDYGTKKLKNLMENPKAALVVDEFRPNRGLMLTGRCEIYERGKEYIRFQRLLYDRFEYYRNNPWNEGEAPILKLIPEKVSSWSI
ncbi:MAG: pyridoxamine 5'-phosphate oxidase family protein [Conexivisphaerales archaeon]